MLLGVGSGSIYVCRNHMMSIVIRDDKRGVDLSWLFLSHDLPIGYYRGRGFAMSRNFWTFFRKAPIVKPAQKPESQYKYQGQTMHIIIIIPYRLRGRKNMTKTTPSWHQCQLSTDPKTCEVQGAVPPVWHREQCPSQAPALHSVDRNPKFKL